MQSPFPGMDPYLETPDLWPDVHHGLISQMRAVLNSALRPTYVARIALREYISDDDTLLDNEVKEARIEIRHVATRSVVTLIEILKHTNKAAGTQGQASFLSKQQETLDSDANWVELDLLRAGLPSMTSSAVQGCDYRIIIRRGGEAKVRWRPVEMRRPLPVIDIPLREPDPDILVDLGTILRATYECGAYDRSIDYREQPDPPLNPRDAAWAHHLLREQGLR